MSDCLFCKFAAGEIPVRKLYEDESVLAFYDIAPVAPVHFLVIPKAHIASCAEITAEHGAVLGHIFAVVARLADELGLSSGFRMVANTGPDAGQTVPHLHVHVLAGRDMSWPPG